ncbi:MAG: hypothetical protein ACOC9W_04735 [Persicimonas sp.]
MADKKTNGVAHLSDSFLATTRELVQKGLEEGVVDEDRDAFFEALYMLQSGDLDSAVDGFRSAARKCESPFDALSMVALAECQRIQGREAAAIREWKKIAADDEAPRAARYVAWRSLAALAERREDQRLLEKANDALEQFPDHH